MRLTKWLMILSLGLVLAACGGTDTPPPEPETPVEEEPDELITENAVVDVAAEAGLTTFVQALEDAFGDEEYRRDGPYTLFAPTNAAFAAADPEALGAEDLLEYHIVQGTYTLEDLETGALETVSGLELEVSAAGGNVTLNGEVSVTSPNSLSAANGVVHAVDGLLVPPDEEDIEEEEGVPTAYSATLIPIPDEVEDASGSATATLEGETLTVTGSAQNLTSAITAVGLFEGGGDDAGVLFYDLEVSGTDFSGTFTLSAEELQILEGNEFFVKVSTETYPEGEASGPLRNEE